jgi:hypothetical protein
MNFKTTYLLFAALILVLVIFGLSQWLGVKPPGELSAYVLPSLNKEKDPAKRTKAKDFDAVEIQRFRPKEETLLFVRRGDDWSMERPYRLHADRYQVGELIRQVFEAQKDKDVGRLSSNLDEYDLTSPSAVVTLKKASDKEWKLSLGAEGPGTSPSRAVYVVSSDIADKAMAVRRSTVEALFKEIDDFRSKDLLEASAFNTAYVNLQEPKKDPVILEKTSDGKWRFDKPAFGDADYDGEPAPMQPGGLDRGSKPITGVKDLLEAVGSIRIDSNADFGPPQASDKELARFGLEQDHPAFLRIEIKRNPSGLLGGDEKKEPIREALLIGNKIDDKSDKRYARLESENAVAKINAKPLEGIVKVAANPAAVRSRNLVEVDEPRTDAIDIKNPTGLLKLRKQAKWKLYAGSGEGRDADEDSVRELLTALNNKRQVKEFPDPSKEAEYGFDKPEAMVVSLWVEGIAPEEEKKEGSADDKKTADDKKPADDKKTELKKNADTEPKLKDAKPTVKLTFGKEEKETVYVRREKDNQKTIVAVPKSILAKVNPGPIGFLDRTLVATDQFRTDAIDLQNGSGLLKLRKPQTKWKLFTDKAKGREADDGAVQALLTALSQKRQIQDFPDPSKEPEYGFDKPAAVLSIWVDGVVRDEEKKAGEPEKKPDEKTDADAEPKLKDAKPTAKLTFGKENKDTVFVRREAGDKKVIAAVPKTLLTTVNQGPLAFLDRTLPSFSEKGDVLDVAIDRDGETHEVTKEGTDWKLTKPQNVAGRTANKANVDRVVADLRMLRPEKLVAEGNVDPDKYGLKMPALKATVKVKGADDKPEEWVYSLGKETEDKSGVYAKQNKRDVIFTVRNDLLTTLRSDLRDLSVVQFAADKVKSLKISGWKQAVGSTFTLELDRQAPRTWTAKMPSDFNLDSNQAEDFLTTLAGLRAEKFLPVKGPQPEHKLGPKDARLQIEISVEGEKTPVTLTIGDLNVKDKVYYAQSSTWPNAVFTLSQDRLEKVLASPKYFTKPAEAGK